MTTTTAIRATLDALRADDGPALRQAAGTVAAVIAAVYVAGEITRARLDALADGLAALWVRLLGLEPTAPQAVAVAAPLLLPAAPEPAPEAEAAAAAVRPARRRRVAAVEVRQQQAAAAPAVGIAAPPLAGLTVAQLRTLASRSLGPGALIGGRKIRAARKADLLEALG
jgi:hypothetical protein